MSKLARGLVSLSLLSSLLAPLGSVTAQTFGDSINTNRVIDVIVLTCAEKDARIAALESTLRWLLQQLVEGESARAVLNAQIDIALVEVLAAIHEHSQTYPYTAAREAAQKRLDAARKVLETLNLEMDDLVARLYGLYEWHEQDSERLRLLRLMECVN